ncbi:MAG: acyl-coenzyme A thioesterase PaaI-like protein [Oceanicoccus sp.]|jgi:acyl-coenzyme A thioesterase PaaI-like protein
MKAIQDLMSTNHCYGCGPENAHGLQLKSYWQDDGTTTGSFTPQSFHNAGPLHFLNGGIQATLIDCHGICAALADAYHRVGREVGEGETLWYATRHMEVSYLKPVAIDQQVELIAVIESYAKNKTVVNCELRSGGEVCTTGVVIAVRVPNSWFES